MWIKAVRLQSLSPFSMALIAAIRSGSCMKARLGTVTVEQSTHESWTATGRTRVSGHIHNDHGAGPEGLDQLLESFQTGMEFERLLCWLRSTDVMVAEVIAKMKEVGLTVGAEKTHWTSHPKMMDASMEEVLGFVGSKVCLDGNARYAIAHRSAQANWRLWHRTGHCWIEKCNVEQSSDEPGTSARSAGISSHLHNDHGIGAARLDKELDCSETGLETGRLCAGCDLPCGRCGVDRCIDVCCRINGVRSGRKT